MKKIIATIGLLLLVNSVAHAQIYKCKNAQGKMEYSDVPCAGPGSATVNIVAPSFGGDPGPGGDPNARALKILEDDRRKIELDQLKSGRGPAECRFKYYSIGDAKGKILSKNAKAECIDNIERKAKGQPISREAYNLWKDHHTLMSNNRNAEAAEITANANAQQLSQQLNQTNQKLNNIENKTYRCRPSYGRNEVECR